LLLRKNVETKPPNLSANPVSFSSPLSPRRGKREREREREREIKSVGTCKAWYRNEEIL
jgi:hypothetical protein